MGSEIFQTLRLNPAARLPVDYTTGISMRGTMEQGAIQTISSAFDVPAASLTTALDKLRAGNARPPDANQIDSAINDIAMLLAGINNGVLPLQQPPAAFNNQPAGQDSGRTCNVARQPVGPRQPTVWPGTGTPAFQPPVSSAAEQATPPEDVSGSSAAPSDGDPGSQIMDNLRYLLQVLGIPPEQIDRILSLLLQKLQQSSDTNDTGASGATDASGNDPALENLLASLQQPDSSIGDTGSTDTSGNDISWEDLLNQIGMAAGGGNGSVGTGSASPAAPQANPGSPSQPHASGGGTDTPRANGPRGTTPASPASPASSATGSTRGNSATYVAPNPMLEAEIARRQKTDPAGAKALRALSEQPVSSWYTGGQYGASKVKDYSDGANAAGKTGLVTVYNVTDRDLGNFSKGGASSTAEYLAGVKDVATSIGNHKTNVILEPDALMHSIRMDPAAGAARRKMMSQAVDILTAQPNTTVSIAAGVPGWGKPSKVADLLIEAGIGKARNFSVGESSFVPPDKLMAYGDAIVAELAKRGVTGVHYSVDTSRNGVAGHAKGTASWAEMEGGASGHLPTTDQAIINNPNVSAFNWVKTPWAADGRIAEAGSFIPDYAVELVNNAHANGIW